MKLLLDFLPIVLFVATYFPFDIYVATTVLMVTTVLQMGYLFVKNKRLDVLQRVTLILILVFGGLTLYLHDPRFIQWKPTFLYAGMAIGLASGPLFVKKNFVELLLSKQLTLPTHVWRNLNLGWIAYCVFMSCANAIAVQLLTEKDWFYFKILAFIFPIAFLAIQAIYLAKYIETPTNDSNN